MTPEELKSLSSNIIQQHQPMMNLYQTMAENFYPERANFTRPMNISTEFADTLAESNPVLLRRDLGDSLSSMLRDGEWFIIGIDGETNRDGGAWLEWATHGLMGMMNQRTSNFIGATKEADHDYITFGSPVISIEINKQFSGLLYRAWHLRDCSWFDDENGQVSGFVRQWKPTYRELIRTFGADKLDSEITKDQPKNAFKNADIRHIVLPIDMCEKEEYQGKDYKYVSYFLDVKNQKVIEEKPLYNNMYVVPRFRRFPGTQFAYSPATATGLPDARTGQTMQHTLLEVAERYARPPIIGTQKVIRGSPNLEPDGITWVSDEYDERMGAALRTLDQDKSGYPIGLDARQDVRETLKSAFYANRLSLPDVSHEMTAYEVAERMKQYRRENLPLFQPMEIEYNGQLCEKSFDIAYAAGFFGSPQDVPESLLGQDIVFKFISPLTESEDEKKANQFQAVSQLVEQAKTNDPTAGANVNWDGALRDAIKGTGAPESWKMSEEQVLEAKQTAMMAEMAQAAAQNPELVEGMVNEV